MEHNYENIWSSQLYVTIGNSQLTSPKPAYILNIQCPANNRITSKHNIPTNKKLATRTLDNGVNLVQS